MESKPYVVALYTRMSKEDNDVGLYGNKEESNSITNQRMLLYDYLKTHPEFHGYEVKEFCDDGFSGKRIDRPQFNEMLDLVRKGKINCIIVKDFSRFCRDYIEIGNYLEQLFPFLGIRFIAVTDNYDSKDNGTETAGLEVVFKNYIADFYSRDTSKKLRSTRSEMAREGKFASANAPYGYLKSPEDKHKLIVDEEAAPVVRKIFELKLAGLSALKITRMLNESGIPSPAQYALQKKRGMDWRRKNSISGWDSAKVIGILKDERYAGNMVSLKRTLKGIYGKDTPVEKENWIMVENTHEGIVSYEDFLRVQETFKVYQKHQPKKIDRTNAFECAHCGRKLSYSRDRKKLICRYGEVNPQAVCSNAAYSDEKLRGAVMAALQWHFEQFLHWEEIQKTQQKKEEADFDTSLYERSITNLEKKKTRLYEKYREGDLTRDEYMKQRSEANAEVEELQSKVRAIEAKRTIKKNGNARVTLLSELIHQYQDVKTFTKELERIFVEQVLVYDAKHIKIKWKFDDVFMALLGNE